MTLKNVSVGALKSLKSNWSAAEQDDITGTY